MKLTDYLTSNGITSKKFARQMRVSISSVNKWRIGNRMPSFKRAMKIEKVTTGCVRLKDWHH